MSVVSPETSEEGQESFLEECFFPELPPMGWGTGSQQKREKHITIKAIMKMKLRSMKQCIATKGN